MKHLFAFGVIIPIIFLSAAADGGTQKHLSTNYEVFDTQVGTVADSIISVLSGYRTGWADPVRAMVNYKKSKFDLRGVDNFVRQRIEEHLLGSKFQVVMDSSSAAFPPNRVFGLSVTVPLVEVDYSAPVASHIFSSSEIVRTVRSTYDVEIAGSGEVKFARSYSFSSADTIEQSEISEVEKGSFDFLHGRSDPSGFIDSIVQPLIFAASAAIIVYLFFTLRGS